jgi:hypothetical protein
VSQSSEFCPTITLCVASQRVLFLLLFISLSTQSGNFWIHPRSLDRTKDEGTQNELNISRSGRTDDNREKLLIHLKRRHDDTFQSFVKSLGTNWSINTKEPQDGTGRPALPSEAYDAKVTRSYSEMVKVKLNLSTCLTKS